MSQVINVSKFPFKKKEERHKIICYTCKNKKKNSWKCSINVVNWLDYEKNQCKYYIKKEGADEETSLTDEETSLTEEE